MKNKVRFLIVAAAFGLLSSAVQARAGGSDSCCDKGIAASPKVQAMLDEPCNNQCAAPGQVTVSKATRQTDIAASPKVQQMRNELAHASVVVPNEVAVYRPTGSDGITASPKVRAQLDEHSQMVQIAPLK